MVSNLEKAPLEPFLLLVNTSFMNNFRVSLVQADLVWEDKMANLSNLESLVSQIDQTDLIILPEMFPTGFSMRPEMLFDEVEGESLQWMKKLAKKKDSAICGSVIVKEGGSYYNRLYFVKPDGDVETYDKRHLFTLAGEEKIYTAGKQRLLVEWKGWKILPYVCYDLRFPAWCRNVEEADLMIFVANWPERRREAWQTLLKARAIENMCYLVGVNRVGADGNGVMHSGDSAMHDELGNLIESPEPFKEQVITVELDREKMLQSRKRFNFLNDRDEFDIRF